MSKIVQQRNGWRERDNWKAFIDLRWADLRGANLREADLFGANLRGANLRGADLNWRSHDLLSEILKQKACGDISCLLIAGLPLVSYQLCWPDYMKADLPSPGIGWVFETLAPWVKDIKDLPVEIQEPMAKQQANCLPT